MTRIVQSAIAAEPGLRPRSAVSAGVGWAGLAGLLTWFVICRSWPDYGQRALIALGIETPPMPMSGPFAAYANILACGLPMVLWSVLVDKVHRNPTTGIDWDVPPRPLSETLDISLTKLAGLWATWALIGCVYALARFYWQGNYVYAMNCFMLLAPLMFIVSPAYVIWLDRRLTDPKDGAWAFGHWLMGGARDAQAIADHLRAWTVKGFFLAFMLSIVPGGFADIVSRPWADIEKGPVALANWLISFMFVIDVALATVGYALTMKPLDAHIRSATPYAAGWVAALICYPPFVLMGPGGPLDYHPGTYGENSWGVWLEGQTVLLWVWGAALVALTAIYAWATMAFGIRFSNLTHRGILTHGPYAWVRHPAYWSKNAYWWLATLPFFVTTDNWVDAVRNSAILALVSAVYAWRAWTEEKHLSSDPDFRAYVAWMDINGPFARLFKRSK
jgi:protein-S-isoprenylcysteine O-methyltransferase Ste14